MVVVELVEFERVLLVGGRKVVEKLVVEVEERSVLYPVSTVFVIVVVVWFAVTRLVNIAELLLVVEL